MNNSLRDTSSSMHNVLVMSDKLSGSGEGKKLCLVSDARATYEPTAAGLAEQLVRDGWQVTLLDLATHAAVEQAPVPYQIIHLRGVHEENNWYTPMQSLCVYQWLRDKDFDLVVFQHGFGAGYFSTIARQQGIALVHTPIVIMAEDPYMWWLEKGDYAPPAIRTDIEIDFLEHEAVRRADAVFASRLEVLEWMQQWGWKLPAGKEKCAVLGQDDGISWGKWLAQISPSPKVGKADKVVLPKVKISLCLAVSAKSGLLDEVLASIAEQNYDDFDVVLVDYGSAHPQKAVFCKLYARFFEQGRWHWDNSLHSGVNQARNRALELAKGTHILPLNDTMILVPYALELMAQVAQKGMDILISVPGIHPKIGVLWPLAFVPARKPGGMSRLPVAWVTFGSNLNPNFFFNPMPQGDALFKREILKELGGFRDLEKGAAYHELLIRAFVAGHAVEVIPEVLLLTRATESRRGRKESLSDRRQIIASLLPSFPENLRPYFHAMMVMHFVGNLKEPGRFPENVTDQKMTLPKTHRLFDRKSVDSDTINVIFTLNDAYCVPTAVMLASLLTNTKSPVSLHGIADISLESEAFLRKVAKHFGATINFVDVNIGAYESMPSMSIHDNTQSKVVYSRMFLADYMTGLKRAIALDSDIIVRHDINQLWQTDLGDNTIAAVPDGYLCLDPKFKNQFVMSPKHRDILGGNYFNMGVLLIDFDRWREQKVSEAAVNWLKYFEDNLLAYQIGDQTPMNLAIAGRWLKLSPTWNMGVLIKKSYAPHYQMTEKRLESLEKDPAIYHFLTHEKPWHEECVQHQHFTNEYRVYEKMVRALIKDAA